MQLKLAHWIASCSAKDTDLNLHDRLDVARRQIHVFESKHPRDEKEAAGVGGVPKLIREWLSQCDESRTADPVDIVPCETP